MSLFNWGKGQSTQESMHAAYFAEYERHRLLRLSDSLDNLAWREAQGRVRAAESRLVDMEATMKTKVNVKEPMFCMTCKKQLYPVEECQCSPFEDIRKKIAALLNKHCNPATVNAHMDEIMPLIEDYIEQEVCQRWVVAASRVLPAAHSVLLRLGGIHVTNT
jgi:hypothetical protein